MVALNDQESASDLLMWSTDLTGHPPEEQAIRLVRHERKTTGPLRQFAEIGQLNWGRHRRVAQIAKVNLSESERILHLLEMKMGQFHKS